MRKSINLYISTILLSSFVSGSAFSAIALDRTRIVFNGDQKSVSLTITNKNNQLPYLAQGWVENSQGQKITSPFAVLPPVQRVEPEKSTQVRIEALPEIATLPQDRESIYYFNLREIPPKSDKPNVLQLALQSKIKLFYRPTGILLNETEMLNNPWQEKMQLMRKGDQFIVKNPTPFFITVIGAAATKNSPVNRQFQAIMIAPFGEENLGVTSSTLGQSPVLTYINDYGGRPKLQFKCLADICQTIPDTK
ncbi:fimbria/pilus periplasmic chaperone [Providencia burhodogranariea]|uniref:Pili chaperone protein n=1 Tax=Providencia burhodogranariea DSM 19968 TaxID=1141662 RepID=K8W856_9GAMM|nr:fimbria/pilus periplasmic chaperone [Providencia burhodogranariea]EKT53662.1 pili chaperone protein [Providencia burhodogranariea DSM 19968]